MFERFAADRDGQLINGIFCEHPPAQANADRSCLTTAMHVSHACPAQTHGVRVLYAHAHTAPQSYVVSYSFVCTQTLRGRVSRLHTRPWTSPILPPHVLLYLVLITPPLVARYANIVKFNEFLVRHARDKRKSLVLANHAHPYVTLPSSSCTKCYYEEEGLHQSTILAPHGSTKQSVSRSLLWVEGQP